MMLRATVVLASALVAFWIITDSDESPSASIERCGPVGRDEGFQVQLCWQAKPWTTTIRWSPAAYAAAYQVRGYVDYWYLDERDCSWAGTERVEFDDRTAGDATSYQLPVTDPRPSVVKELSFQVDAVDELDLGVAHNGSTIIVEPYNTGCKATG